MRSASPRVHHLQYTSLRLRGTVMQLNICNPALMVAPRPWKRDSPRGRQRREVVSRRGPRGPIDKRVQLGFHRVQLGLRPAIRPVARARVVSSSQARTAAAAARQKVRKALATQGRERCTDGAVKVGRPGRPYALQKAQAPLSTAIPTTGSNVCIRVRVKGWAGNGSCARLSRVQGVRGGTAGALFSPPASPQASPPLRSSRLRLRRRPPAP